MTVMVQNVVHTSIGLQFPSFVDKLYPGEMATRALACIDLDDMWTEYSEFNGSDTLAVDGDRYSAC